MTLTMQEFRAGVDYWRASPWPNDFHNEFYARLAAENPEGEFTSAWWPRFLVHLQAWRATRPVSGQVMTRGVEHAFSELSDTWRVACEPYLSRDIAGVTWAEIGAFPDLVARLKPRRGGRGHAASPVFRSKFCHFLTPAIYPVVDTAVMGLPFGRSYKAHLEGVQTEWSGTPEVVRTEARDELEGLIGRPLTPGYPLVNKVVEICLIGRRARSSG